MVTFAGPFRDPTEDWEVATTTDEHGKQYAYVRVKERCQCGHECCNRRYVGEGREHTSKPRFYVAVNDDDADAFEDIADAEDAASDWIEEKSRRINEQYDDYLEENRHSIVQMERYEMFQREY